MKHYLEDREMKWDHHYRENILLGTGIVDMTEKVLAPA
jgi:hypothetical protein